jgi:sugar phosphate isomerase/epimerase
MKTNRRGFLKGGAALAAASFIPAEAKAAPAPAAAPKIKLSLAAYSLRKYLDLKNPTMTLEEFIGKCAEWGCDGTELTEYYFKKPLTPEYLMKIKHTAIKVGLPITGTPVGNTFTLPPGEARDKQIAAVNAWVDVSAELGSPAVRIFAGSAPKGVEEAQARAWAIECINICLEHAAKRGVYLALENHGGIVATAEGMLAIMTAIKHDWFGVNWDTGNFHSADPYAELEKIAPYAITCQVKAEISRAGRHEDSDFPRLVEMLRKANYGGFMALEYESAEEPMTAIPKNLALLRKALG